MRPMRVDNSRASGRNWTKIERVRKFMPVLIICMFDEDPIKNGRYRTDIFPIICLQETKWQITQM